MDHLNKLTIDEIFEYIELLADWTKSREFDFFNKIKNYYLLNGVISKRQRQCIVRLAIRLNERRGRQFNFQDYKRSYYKK